jgi:hypothetical protein
VRINRVSSQAMTTYSDGLCSLFAEGDALRGLTTFVAMTLLPSANTEVVLMIQKMPHHRAELFRFAPEPARTILFDKPNLYHEA